MGNVFVCALCVCIISSHAMRSGFGGRVLRLRYTTKYLGTLGFLQPLPLLTHRTATTLFTANKYIHTSLSTYFCSVRSSYFLSLVTTYTDWTVASRYTFIYDILHFLCLKTKNSPTLYFLSLLHTHIYKYIVLLKLTTLKSTKNLSLSVTRF